MNKITAVVFDLDGTLVKSHQNIYKATLHSFETLKINAVLPEQEFYLKIGHHFEDIFEDFGIKIGSFDEFIKVYKTHYFDFIDHSFLYGGVEKVLKELKSSGYSIALLTTKGQEQADKIVEHFGLTLYFDYVMGRKPGINHKPSPEPLLKICEELKIEPANTLMVGDTELDIQCGKNAGAVTCGVTYGYRSKEIIKSLEPDYIIDNIGELMNIL